ncbi:MAG: helix-turn-helix domain-containing protein [Clostridium sp.]|nr:helix-turn-helix domain-containing protein [Clostridium sp.]
MAFHLNQTTAQQIVETVKNVCGRDINFIHPDGKIFASTDEARIGDFHEIGFEAARSRQTIEVREGGRYHGTQPGVNMPFLWDGTLIAVIGVTGNPDDVREYARLSRRIAQLILREQELDLLDRSRRSQAGYIVNALISGQAPEREYLNDFLSRYHLTERSLLRAVIMRPQNGETGGESVTAEFESADIISDIGTDLVAVRYPDEYVILCENRKQQELIRRLTDLSRRHTPAFRIGVGSAETVFGQENSYRTALLALRSLRDGQVLASYESLDLQILLSSAKPAIRDMLRKKTADLIDRMDTDCLRAYFSCNMSVKAASEQLFIHKNTLQYHLDRVHRLTGYNPRIFRDAVVLWAGMESLEYR